MGLLDWLTDSLGGGGGGSMPPMGGIVSGGTPMQPDMPPMDWNPQMGQFQQRRHSPPLPTGPMPPVQMTGMDIPLPPGGDPLTADMRPGQYPMGGDPMTADRTAAPYRPYPAGGDPMTAGGIPPGPYPPAGDPMTAGGVPPEPPMPPMPGGKRVPVYGGSGGQPPGPPMPILPPGNGTNGVGPGMGVATPADLRNGGGAAQARTIIGRALGLDPNREAMLSSSLSAGLKSVGENYRKPGLAALSGSAGSAMQGGEARDDKTVDQQGKVIDRATRLETEKRLARSGTIADQLNISRAKLAEEQAKMTREGRAGGSVVNSQQQLYLRAMGLVNGDPEVKLAKSTYDAAIKVGDANSPEVKAAKKAHEDLVKAKTAAHLQTLGLDPKMADKLGKQPGMAMDNPIDTKGFTQQKLNELPVGSYIRTPDGKVLQKKAPAAAAAGATQPVPAQAMTPAVQPPLPPAVSGARAEMGADDEDE